LTAIEANTRGGLTEWLRSGGRVLVPLLVLGVGAVIAFYLMSTRPSAERRVTQPQARLVEIETASWVTREAKVETVGVVVPARRVELRVAVSGDVVEIAAQLEPGGRFRAGDVLLRIDPRDYELAIRQRRADLAEAEAELALEMGNQTVAQREFAILGEEILPSERELVLREPQLRASRARIERARAALQAAELDRERTAVRAPFDAIVEQRSVELGSRADAGTVVATLVATDTYWVEVALAVADLRWIDVPDADGIGSPAQLWLEGAWPEGVTRSGHVVRRYAGLETEGRLARLLIAVADPLGDGSSDGRKPAMLLGSVVRVELKGLPISGVPLARGWLHDDANVWLMTDANTLEIRPVAIGFRGRDEVIVTSGLTGGERIVVSDLAAPVAGMALRVATRDTDG